MKTTYTDHRARRLAAHGWIAIALAGVLGLFTAMATLGSGGHLMTLHWYVLAVTAMFATVSIMCTVAAGRINRSHYRRSRAVVRPIRPMPVAWSPVRPQPTAGATAADVARFTPRAPRPVPVAAIATAPVPVAELVNQGVPGVNSAKPTLA